MGKLGVLIVSHSEETAIFAANTLAETGLCPAYGMVGNARELTEALTEEKWDAVVAEYGHGGLPWAEAMQAVRAAKRRIPFIVLARECDFESFEEAALAELDCVRAGADDFVPAHDARLVPAMIRSLREARERRELAAIQNKLTLAESRYRGMFENAVNGIFRLAPWGALLDANPALARKLGFDSPETLLASVKQREGGSFLEPGVLEELMSLAQQPGGVEDFETRVVRGDGEAIWVSLSAGAVRGAAGELSSFEGTLEDVTRRKSVESMIVRAKREWESTFDSVDNVILILDENMRIRRLNWALAQHLGLHPRECAGKPLVDILPGDGARLTNGVREMLASGGRSLEMRLDDLGGDYLVTASPFVGQAEGDEGSVVVVAHDVSERKMLEDRLRRSQKMEAMGTLAGGIAHDFNNILGVMMGYAEMCMEEPGQSEANAKRLQEVIAAGRRASELIRQILTFSRQEETELRPLALGPAVKEIAKMLKASLPANIELRLELSASDHTVMANLTQFHQVVMNLVSNAAHSMPESGGLVRVSLGLAQGEPEDMEARQRLGVDGDLVRLTVADTGVGIDPEILDNIFDPFFTTKKPGSGTGLGLSLVHGIVSAHAGAVIVRSTPGKGSVFHVYLPESADPGAAQPQEPARLPELRGTALFVDDEDGLVEVGKRMLESMGFTVVAESDPLKALEAFERDPKGFDLLVTDQTMPGLTGAELAKMVLAKRPDLPVIVCTGFSETLNRERARELGIKGYLHKPVLRRDLAEAVKAVFPG